MKRVAIVQTNADRISDMEAEVMKIVWGKGAPITYAEIRAALNKSYNLKSQVVNTMIKRLVQKGALHEEKRDVYYYSALAMEDDYIKSKTMSLVHKVFNGDVKNLLSALVSYEQVTPEDLESLKEFWKKGGN
jgi:predicted transcriptional regulator